jgi:hypothetical protein
MNKPRLFIGVACHEPTQEFVSSLGVFLPELRKHYNLTYQEVWGEELVVAQNIIARSFLSSHTDWLLMLEDDHSGHTVEMVDDLINSNHRFCGIKYHSRWYPYTLTALNERYELHLFNDKDYDEVALIGFGMTLIHRSVFYVLEKPYFRLNEVDKNIQSYATDRDFCQRLIEKGIVPVVCNKHCLTHRGINDTNVIDKMMAFPYRTYRDEQIAEKKARLLCQN